MGGVRRKGPLCCRSELGYRRPPFHRTRRARFPRSPGLARLVPSHSGSVDDAANQRTYWHLPAADRSIQEAKLRALPPRWPREAATGGAYIYEAQRDAALLLVVRSGLPANYRSLVLNASLAAALVQSSNSIGVCPAGLVSREIRYPDPFGVAALIVSFPQLTMTAAHIGNDSLAIAIGSLLLLLLFRWKKEPSSMGRALAQEGLEASRRDTRLHLRSFSVVVPADVAPHPFSIRRTSGSGR
jgi:hypothetical protein